MSPAAKFVDRPNSMKYRTLPGIAKPISQLIQGTVMVSGDRFEESGALLDGIFALGANTFDTAHVYGGGDNERTVGKWVASRGIRDRVVILGKGAHPYHGRNRVTPEDIAADLHESLDRFGFDSIDLYVLHRDDESIPVGEIVDALDRHQKEGLIDAFGGSNWSHHRIAAANEYARVEGKAPFAVSSPQFGLAYPQKEVWEGCVTIGGPDGVEARRWYAENEVALLPWSSLGGGIFSGRFHRDNLTTFAAYLDVLCAECYGHEANFERYDRAARLATERGVSPAQIAMAWVLQQPMRPIPLVGCGSPKEFAENAAAIELELDADTLRWLEDG